VPLPHWVTRVNRRFANHAMLLVAPRVPPFAVLHHRGRRTGREYRTPVLAFRSPRGVVIPLFYGLEVEWLRNVLLAGSVSIVRRGWRYRLGEVDIRSGEAVLGLVPGWVRPGLRIAGVHHALEGRIVRATRAVPEPSPDRPPTPGADV
jgi:hypothetical protein